MLLPLFIGCVPTDPKDTSPVPAAHTGTEVPLHTSGTTPTPPHSGSTETTPTADTGAPPATERDRLLRTYLAHLQRFPDITQFNGLRGADLDSVCELWDGLQPSARNTFLTITHRLEGSILPDGTSALPHVVTLYWAVGGEGATATTHGECGGAGNRLILSIDPTLHAAMVASHGAGPRIADIPAGSEWKDSSDLAGPHDPFTMSNDTDDGAPRGQVHFFSDPTSTVANSPLGLIDLEDLVDPYAFEIDQDYDCVHHSNPDCDYTFYGPFCLPEPTRQGSEIYQSNYGDFDPGFAPQGC